MWAHVTRLVIFTVAILLPPFSIVSATTFSPSDILKIDFSTNPPFTGQQTIGDPDLLVLTLPFLGSDARFSTSLLDGNEFLGNTAGEFGNGFPPDPSFPELYFAAFGSTDRVVPTGIDASDVLFDSLRDGSIDGRLEIRTGSTVDVNTLLTLMLFSPQNTAGVRVGSASWLSVDSVDFVKPDFKDTMGVVGIVLGVIGLTIGTIALIPGVAASTAMATALGVTGVGLGAIGLVTELLENDPPPAPISAPATGVQGFFGNTNTLLSELGSLVATQEVLFSTTPGLTPDDFDQFQSDIATVRFQLALASSLIPSLPIDTIDLINSTIPRDVYGNIASARLDIASAMQAVTQPVPEPHTILLVGGGVLLLIKRQRARVDYERRLTGKSSRL
jgi:hypothetical protein